MNMIATVGVAALITGEITSKTVGFTINALSGTLSYMTSISEDLIIKKYREELEVIDIEFKLKIIQEWLDSNTKDNSYSERHDELYKSISTICSLLTIELQGIEKKIKDHKSKWFHTWRTLDLSDEINHIKRNALILNERILLIMVLSQDRVK